MKFLRSNSLHVLVAATILVFASQAAAQDPVHDYSVQGEYTGTLDESVDGLKLGLQVIALGKGKFSAAVYHGGLPGDGWNGEEPIRPEESSIKDGLLRFEAEQGKASISDGVATVISPDGEVVGRLMQTSRKSPTLGAKPPTGATVLFDGTSVDGWKKRGGKPAIMTEDGLLTQGAMSKEKFQDHRLHIEFLLPFEPNNRGQKRGNSGIYLQGRYEVQMLDSFGLSGEHNECGGIYTIRKPSVNMCFPPQQWQTYDIEFHAAKFDGEKKTQNAWITVKHNGVLIHEKVELPKKTTAAPNNEGPEPGYVYLQDHSNEVRYQNIWVSKVDAKSAEPDVATDSARVKHSLITQGNEKLAIIDSDGEIEWEMKWGGIHDIHMLDSGNILTREGRTKVVEIDRNKKEVVWTYDCETANGNSGKKVEVHAFQPLTNGNIMVAESGPARIIEVNRDGEIQKEIKLKVENPHPHMDTRLARKIKNGNYLVCHEGDGVLREYDGDGNVVFEFEVPMFGKEAAGGHGPKAWGNKLFGAVRLSNGNTLIATGNGHSVIEVTPEKKIVWHLKQNELPGITFAWVTTLEVLSNGNYVIGNCHAGPGQPLLVEIEPKSKKVVWTFDQFETFGNSVSNSQLLDVKDSLR